MEINSLWGRNYNYFFIDTSSFSGLTNPFLLIPVTTESSEGKGAYGLVESSVNSDFATIWSVSDDKMTVMAMRKMAKSYNTISLGSIKND